MRGDDPDRYEWVARESSYESAGCLTLVSGLDLERALIAVGADPLRQAHESGAFAPEGLAALAAVSVPWKEPAVVLIEENGYEGSRDEVLRALSKKGIAASAYWNVNGVVRFGCARRGKVLYTSELPDDEADEAPRVLRSLATAAEADDANLVAIAVAMAATYTGIEVPRIDEVSRPALFHPITNPVLGLRVTAEELVGLGYPTPDLVSAAQSATSQECRRLVRWAVLDAVQGAGLRNHPAVAEIVDQLDGAGPAALGSRSSTFGMTPRGHWILRVTLSKTPTTPSPQMRRRQSSSRKPTHAVGATGPCKRWPTQLSTIQSPLRSGRLTAPRFSTGSRAIAQRAFTSEPSKPFTRDSRLSPDHGR